jgi:hypothetical protein
MQHLLQQQQQQQQRLLVNVMHAAQHCIVCGHNFLMWQLAVNIMHHVLQQQQQQKQQQRRQQRLCNELKHGSSCTPPSTTPCHQPCQSVATQ